jgi:hypothetical protein
VSDGRLGRVTTCRSCDRVIRWCVTKNGKKMPVDVTPSPRGNIVLVPRHRGEPPRADVYKDHTDALGAAGDTASTYTSHFVTCPHAATHRR